MSCKQKWKQFSPVDFRRNSSSRSAVDVCNMNTQQLERDVREFRELQTQHNTNVAAILTNYEKLLQDYERLAADYDEARESREKYKKISKDAVRGRALNFRD